MDIIKYFDTNFPYFLKITVIILSSVITSISLSILLRFAFRSIFSYWIATRNVLKVYRTKQKEKAKEQEKINELWIYRQLNYLLQSTTKATEDSTKNFIMILVAFFVSVFVVMQGLSLYANVDNSLISGVIFRLIVSVIVSSMPILFLIIKLRINRIQAGYDLAHMTGIMLSKYRKNKGKMYETLLETAENVNSKYIRRRIYRIARTAQTYVDVEKLKNEIDIFVYSIDTVFARQIGVAILKAFVQRADVEKSLEAVDRGIQRNIQMLNDERSQAQDIISLGYLHPIVFIISLICLIRFLTFSKYWEYQFETKQGQILFILSVVSIVISVFSAIWCSKTKNDQ